MRPEILWARIFRFYAGDQTITEMMRRMNRQIGSLMNRYRICTPFY